MRLKHVLLKNSRLKGLEYGVLRSLEDEIISITGADVIEIPDYGIKAITKRAGHGMRGNWARRFLPKKPFNIDAEVIWYILMGPENHELDLFRGWTLKAKYRIVYIFDTLEHQLPRIKELFSSDDFNIRITTFHEAVPHLEKLTGRKWHAIEQAVPSFFRPPESTDQKLIAFSSYGRRIESFHKVVIDFCKMNGLYYDYSTTNGSNITVSAEELYLQYAWHMRHSMFTISWPVELTNPSRAGRLNPITCRWFEAAASGTVILGRKPDNLLFDEILAPELVVEIDPSDSKQGLMKRLDKIYSDRASFLQKAQNIQRDNYQRWTWDNRVNRILNIIGTKDV